MTALRDCRVAFADTLVTLAEQDSRIVAVCNDSVGSSNLKAFKQRFPDRLINVGIAEQNLVGVSAGLASAGRIPFTCGASCFLTGRALEQILRPIGRVTAATGNTIAWVIGIVGLALLLGVIAYLLRGLRRGMIAEAQIDDDPEANLTAKSALDQAGGLARGGDYRTAVRYMYL